MKFSELWLRELVNPAIDSSALAEQMTMAGLEVECIEPVASSFTGVVVGKVVECRTHPNTNKLWVTKVDIGCDRQLDVVCGAPNCRADLLVVVAKTGAVLPGNLKIKAIKWRGAFSEGMLCSCSELGISNCTNGMGIIELPADSPIGQDIRNYLQLNDNIFSMNVTPNRADCLCLLGIARDVAVLNRMPLVQPVIEMVSPLIVDAVPIHIDQNNACPRYLGRVVKNINVNASTPLWMKEKLRRSGLQSVNTIVDITNYVQLELGQPMHAFDLDRISGGIVVRHARHDEALTLLDGREVKLLPDTLVIADYSKVLAIAGIVGGAFSSIKPTTRDVVLECAFFHPLAITGRASSYGLHTNASYRYERGVDPALQPRAMERATALLISICGGNPGPVIEVTYETELDQPSNIYLQRENLDRLIGYVIPDEEVSNILLRLGFQVSRRDENWQVLTPSWRFDIAIEEDLIEEIVRIYGYDVIPSVPVRANLLMPHHSEAELPLLRAKTLLVDRGYQEAITYSFVNPTSQSMLHPQQEPLVLPRPMAQDMSAMRLSLWTGLLSVVVNNQNRQQKRIRLFESGLRFVPDHVADMGIRQELILAGVITGPQFSAHWDQSCQPVDFYDAKGDIEAILELTGTLNDIEFRATRHPALHPGQSAAIYRKHEVIGLLGMIHPELESKLNLMSCTIVFELIWKNIAKCKIPKAQNISSFPANRRDIAVVVANDVAAADVLAECRKVLANKLFGVTLFDIYRNSSVKAGFKSLAIRLILQDPISPLKEDEINTIVAKCVMAIKQRFHASLRD
ncbi:Phenylalanyl-tRNA synthetase beta chain [Candidatus Moranella endobia PCVAL]|uniref:Phenylalanine--tRNA ligase beta subunit n=1 Tax=Moranella endobia (strain PCIT) TaxID=903503 RepID=F7XXQ8_MOREP|nr:phenylalanine--tRNA ligase subunit beta [Candidatus Moranella endobia]AEI74884.1 phenylalanyl-tRNA synthetase subunit beta [Candidatus Moranella endobia PCIT]AGJ61130.1 Phenylalanyl-tRNA synthetase beta chain [Candidatus Moranella endobia PCVAL]